MRIQLAALLALAACDPRLYAEKREEPKKDDPPSEQPSGPSPFAAFAALDRLKDPQRFDDPKESPDYDSSEPWAAVLELDGGLVDLAAPFSLFGDSGGSEVRRLVARLRELDFEEKHAEKLLLRVTGVGMSAATTEELYDLLGSMRMPVHCHTDSAENLTVVLLAACDSVSVAPTGVIAVTGPVFQPYYVRGLLDLLGIEPDFIPVGAYKGAGEPFMRKEPSPEMRETYDALLDGVFARMKERLAHGRKRTPEEVSAWIDQGLFSAEQAKKVGLIDEVAGYHDWRAAASPKGNWKKIKISEKDSSMELMQLLGGGGRKKVPGPHVTVLYAVGTIEDGEGSGAAPWGEITAHRLVPALREAAADDDVKAIVLRVNSPGGSALASEQIWREVVEAGKKKKVVVSMGTLAASGGYYISAPAFRIFAQPDTLTGSIGVIGGKLALGPALAKIGVNIVDLSRGKRALVGSSVRKWSPDERAAILGLMTEIYDVFLGHVASGRKLPRAEVEKIAQGRVWSGADAKDRGLVDELGGLERAIEVARLEGGVPVEADVEYWPGDPTLADILSALERSFGAPFGMEASLWKSLPPEARRLVGIAYGFTTSPVRAVALITPM